MLEIIDSFCWEDRKKVITYDQHGIAGLRNLAYWNYITATPPTPEHFHSDIMEIHCLLKGKRVCVVGEESYTITGNELFLTYPFEPHQTRSFETSPCTFIAFQINLQDEEHLLSLNPYYSRVLAQLLKSCEFRHLRFTSSDALLLRQAFANISDGSISAMHLGIQFLCCFLFKIQDFIPIRRQEKTIVDANIKRTLAYVEHHYRDNPTLTELAALSGYSLSRFKTKFKEVVGIPPANYISMRKLEYAKEQLSKTDFSITQIALDAGFSSSNYFGTTMKRTTGHSPHDFRALCRAQKVQD